MLRFNRRRLLKAGIGMGAGVAVLPLLAACGGSSGSSSSSGNSTAPAAAGTSTTKAGTEAGTSGKPKMGGKVTMSLADADVKNFDPIIPTDNMSIWTMVLIYDQIVRNGPSGKEVEPGLAEKWDVAPDGLSYTFHLRDAKFHDGSDVTSEDCLYSVNRCAFDKDSQGAWLFSAVDKLETPDAKTLKITLKNKWAPFLADVSIYNASIIPKKLHEAQGAKFFEAPVGSGPFKFNLWEKTNRIVLKKSDSYWEPGKPYLDEIEFLVLTDANTRMLKFQAGELDIATSVPFSQLKSLAANPNYKTDLGGAAKFQYIAMNNTRKPFDDKKVRQAINYAIDKEALIKSVLFGYGKPANTMLPLMLYHNDTVKGYPFDLDQAKKLIAESSAKDGWKATLFVTTGDPIGQQVGQLLKDEMSEIGGEVTIQLVEPGSVTDQIHKLDYDWSTSYYTTDIIDPDELATFGFVSDGGAQSVWTGYKNPEVDTMAKQAEEEIDPDKRKDLYNKMQEAVTDDAPVIFLFYPDGNAATRSNIQDFRILPTGNYRMWEVWKS